MGLFDKAKGMLGDGVDPKSLGDGLKELVAFISSHPDAAKYAGLVVALNEAAGELERGNIEGAKNRLAPHKGEILAIVTLAVKAGSGYGLLTLITRFLG
ncbi:MAG: hypothetical protein LBF51_02745 [Zoogloeaceae bacterium]|jgi:hypothetical protein|nr:hypothetical protein [Zoogloeaceae bacterium]